MQQDPDIPSWSASLLTIGISRSLSSTKSPSRLHKERRVSSLGQWRRRTSDVCEAATRPSPAAAHIAPPALTPSATLSLAPSNSSNLLGRETLSDSEADARLVGMRAGISLPKDRKKGVVFKCETCSKVYRHSSCLVKHRWEHSPHWRETSNFLLSKHQQVQLLEAAAILSHLAPSARGGSSLPEDRALWPAYLSGGNLHLTPSATTTPMNAALSAEESVHEHAVISTSNVDHVRPDVYSVGRSEFSRAMSRTTSFPIALRSAKNTTNSPPRSKSEGGDRGWNSHNPSVASTLSYFPPTKDESDFEMEEEPTLNRTFERLEGKEETGGGAAGWDGLEMEMEM